MPTLTVSTTAHIRGSTNSTFSNAREDNGSFIVNGGSGNVNPAVEYIFSSGRGGGTHRMHRTYLDFDTSGISGTVSSATLNIESLGSNSGDIIGLKTTAFGGSGGGTLSAASFFSTIDYTTAYTAEISTWEAGAGKSAANNAITLNSTARSDMQNNARLQIALVNHTYDYANSGASGAVTEQNAIAFDSVINIDYTIGAASGPANLTSHNGIAKASITSINGITMANITTLNGIS